MNKITVAQKTVTLYLFHLKNLQCENVALAIADGLKELTTVEQRIVELDENRGSACAMDFLASGDFVRLHIGRFIKNASIDIIRLASEDLKKNSIEAEQKSPEKNTDFLKSQAIAVFGSHAAIAAVSDGRDFSLIWAFLRKILGKTLFTPEYVYSKNILDALQKRGIKSIKLDGYADVKSVEDTLDKKDPTLLNLLDRNSDEGKQKNGVKFSMTFVPEKNAKDKISEKLTSLFSRHENHTLDLFDGQMSMIVKTGQDEKIQNDGFYRNKKVIFERKGSFVARDDVYQEIVDWYKELAKNNEWPNE